MIKKLSIFSRVVLVLFLASVFIFQTALANSGKAAIPIGGNFQTTKAFLFLTVPPCEIRILYEGDGGFVRSGSPDENGNRETTFQVKSPGGVVANAVITPDGRTDSTRPAGGGMSGAASTINGFAAQSNNSGASLTDLRGAFLKAVAEANVVDYGFDEDFIKDCQPILDLIDAKIADPTKEVGSIDSDGDGVQDQDEVGSIRTGTEGVVEDSVFYDASNPNDPRTPRGSLAQRTNDREYFTTHPFYVTEGGVRRLVILENQGFGYVQVPYDADSISIGAIDQNSFDITIEEFTDNREVTGLAGDDILTGGDPNVLAIVNPGPDIIDLEVLVSSVAIAPDSAVVYTTNEGDRIVITLAPGETFFGVIIGEPLAVTVNGEVMDLSVVGRYPSAASLYEAVSIFGGFAGSGGSSGDEAYYSGGDGDGGGAIGSESFGASFGGGAESSGAPKTFQETIQGAQGGQQVVPGQMQIFRDQFGQPVNFRDVVSGAQQAPPGQLQIRR